MPEITVAQTTIQFLREIGLTVHERQIVQETVLPGIAIENGGLVVDSHLLLYPGDLLHEAGHLAVLTAQERASRSGNVADEDPSRKQGDEIAAIAWSYAALKHLGFSPDIVFHPNGYHGASEWFIEQYEAGTAMGLPLLQWLGLTLDPSHAEQAGVRPYPHMIKWLRE